MEPVAVVGGGLAGVCAALELAENGVDVDLFEAADELITEASYCNEGKVHLGFVYAMDDSLRTARTMVEGARSFVEILSRYVDASTIDAATSTPFLYAVPRDSMVPTQGVVEHFHRVGELLGEMPGQVDGRLHPSTGWRRLGARELAAVFDDALVDSAFETAEIGIDPHRIAPPLRRAAHAHPRVTVLTSTTVTALLPPESGRAGVVTVAEPYATPRRYGHVVNATWSQRLALDESAGIAPPTAVMHRYKVGLHGPPVSPSVPSTTFIAGLYGDVVRYQDRSYQSWYPAGLLASSTAVAPPPMPTVLANLDRDALREATASALGRLMPSVEGALHEAAATAEVAGGWITAWGSTGIDDPSSRLHERHDVGVASHGPYVTVDTGKYTTAPLFGVRAAHRVLGSRGGR